MALNPLNSSNLEQLAWKGLNQYNTVVYSPTVFFQTNYDDIIFIQMDLDFPSKLQNVMRSQCGFGNLYIFTQAISITY